MSKTRRDSAQLSGSASNGAGPVNAHNMQVRERRASRLSSVDVREFICSICSLCGFLINKIKNIFNRLNKNNINLIDRSNFYWLEFVE